MGKGITTYLPVPYTNLRDSYRQPTHRRSFVPATWPYRIRRPRSTHRDDATRVRNAQRLAHKPSFSRPDGRNESDPWTKLHRDGATHRPRTGGMDRIDRGRYRFHHARINPDDRIGMGIRRIWVNTRQCGSALRHKARCDCDRNSRDLEIGP